MMSDNRAEIHHDLVKNIQNSLDNAYNLHSRKLQMVPNTPIEVSEATEVSKT